MKNNSQYPEIQKILASNPDDAAILKEAGLLSEILAAEHRNHQVLSSIAQEYYDFNTLKKQVLNDVGGYNLQDIEFEPGKYKIIVDTIGNTETAARTFGLDKLGITETDNGYQLDGEERAEIAELSDAEEAVLDYAEQVARDLEEHLAMPGAFYYDFNDQYGDGLIHLWYTFQDQDLSTLQSLGADVHVPEQEQQQAEASFDQIIAALEDEGCHEMARRLHSIIREI